MGARQASLPMLDMPALAARYPSVAYDLERAQPTAEEYDADRAAFITALLLKEAKGQAGPIEPTSPLQHNLEFIEAHPDEIEKLKDAGMFVTT